jgi:hypothetical protein
MRALLLLVMMLWAVAVLAHVPPYMHFQGQLANPDGTPVPDSTYTINFSIWHGSTGGQPVWTETHAVETCDGVFSARLGSFSPLEAWQFTLTSVDTAYLQVQVQGDTPMTPRAMIGTSPTSLFTASVSGDIMTEPGGLSLEENGAEISMACSDQHNTSLLLHPDSEDPFSPTMEISADETGGAISLADPRPTPLFPNVFIRGDSASSAISIADPRPTPVFQDFAISSDINGIIISLDGPEQTPSIPGLYLNANAEGSQMILGDLDSRDVVLEIRAHETSGELNLFNTSTGNQSIEISSDLSGNMIKIHDSQGEDYLKILDSDGDDAAKLFGGGLDINTAGGDSAVQLRTNGVFLYDPVGHDTTIALKVDGDVCGVRAHFGEENQICGTASLVAGGHNTVTGDYSTCPGGYGNSATAAYCFAAGRNVQAVNEGSFMWGDATGGYLSSTTSNQFKCRASGGIYFYSDQNHSMGVYLYPNSSQWHPIPGLDAKHNVRPVDGQDILQKLRQLKVSRWNYKAQGPSIEHIGPMAQDFNVLFGVGEDDRYISTMDPSGVALAGLKELLNVIDDLREKNAELEYRIAELERTGN